MLGNHNAIATLGVKDIKRAKEFYEGALGLQPTPDHQPTTAVYHTGKTTMFVYESQFAGTNEATAATWDVGGEIDWQATGRFSRAAERFLSAEILESDGNRESLAGAGRSAGNRLARPRDFGADVRLRSARLGSVLSENFARRSPRRHPHL